MSVSRRRIAALFALLGLALSTVACSAVREQTQLWREPPRGTSASAGDVAIRNVVVVTGSESNATLYASFANEGDTQDALTGISIGGNEVTPGGGEIELAIGEVTSVSPETTRVDVSGFDVGPGRLVEVQFVFAEAPRTTVQTIVQQNEGTFAHVEFD